MKKIKVFYLVYGLTSGGIEYYSVNLYRYINKEKFKFDFIVKSEDKEFFDDELFAIGGSKLSISKGCKGNNVQKKIQYIKNIINLAKNEYDVAYFNLSSPSAVFKYPLICRLVGIKHFIIHSHNSSEDNIGFLNIFFNILGRFYINKISTKKFACSDKAAEWMFGKKVARNKTYTLISNGIEINKYSFNLQIRAKLRNEYGCKKETIVIGHVGRFVKQKNHTFVIDIFSEVLKIKNDAILLLIGNGPLQNQIIQKTVKLGIRENVFFIGESIHVDEFLQMVDIFLLPSLYEGLPVVGVEAQAAGLKCIFSDTITKDVDITGNIEYLSLSEPVSVWVKKIIETANYSRENQEKKIIKAGFNMETTAKFVEEYLVESIM